MGLYKVKNKITGRTLEVSESVYRAHCLGKKQFDLLSEPKVEETEDGETEGAGAEEADAETLADKTVADLQEMARDLGVAYAGKVKADLVADLEEALQ